MGTGVGPAPTKLELATIVSAVVQELTLTIIFEQGEGGLVVASIPAIPGVFSQGRTREEARANVIDALRLMLSTDPSETEGERESESLRVTVTA